MSRVSSHGHDPESKKKGQPGTIGVIGLGVMGKRMARNLLNAGNRIMVFDIVPSLVEGMVETGAAGATSPVDVAKKCRIVILSLPTAEIVRDVVLGKNGLIDGLVKGSVVVDTSTTNPELPSELSARLLKKKCYFLDAPVSGGPEGAAKATLTVMVGGEKQALKKCMGVLRTIGKSVIHVGDSGTGQKVKLFNQALVCVYFGAVAEAYAWSEKLGLGPQDLLKVIPTSWGDSPVFRHFISTVISKDFADGASIRIYRKDTSLILDSARKSGSNMRLLKLASSMLAKASRMGYDEDDASTLLFAQRAAGNG